MITLVVLSVDLLFYESVCLKKQKEVKGEREVKECSRSTAGTKRKLQKGRQWRLILELKKPSGKIERIE